MSCSMGKTMIVISALAGVPTAWSQQPPDQHPADIRERITQSWDRSALPGDVELIARKTVLGYEAANTLGYGHLHLTCASNAATTTGRCPTADTGEAAGSGSSIVPLRFTEQRSGMSIDMDVQGELLRIDATAACALDYWSRQPRPLWSSAAPVCVGHLPAGTGMGLRIPDSELEKLVAGKWTAKLLLTLRGKPGQQLALHEFDFDLTVTDRNAVAIYFPAFDSISPLVQLNAAYDPIAMEAGGRTVLDMCLYDGLGSQANYLGVTVRNRTALPPGPSGFSLWHGDGGTDATRRLDYTVTLDHNGKPIPMPDGVEQHLQGIDSAKLRLVVLPGMSRPVYCVPTPITFDIPRVPISTQQAGTYFGELNVELRVPTSTP